MKLTQHQMALIQEKTGMEPIPQTTAADAGLSEHFGDDTFYITGDGLFVFEEEGQPGGDGGDRQSVTAVRIAAVQPSAEGPGVEVLGIDPEATSLSVQLV